MGLRLLLGETDTREMSFSSALDRFTAKRLLLVLVGLTSLVLLFSSAGFAQSREELNKLQKEVESLKQEQLTIQKELQAIKNLLQRMQVPPSPQAAAVFLSVEKSPFKGDKNAKVTIIEFSDYQCPFCARHNRETLPQLTNAYIKTGKVKYVFRDFPLESIHQQALKAHEAAYCAGEQGKYWEMHDQLFGNQPALNPPDLARYAQAIGLNTPDFKSCLDSGKYLAKIRAGLAEGTNAGVRGTPTFFLGYTEPNESKIQALMAIRGAHPFARFQEALDRLLSAQKQ